MTALITSVLTLTTTPAWANPDAQWPLLRKMLFGGRTVNTDARQVIELLAPQRAENAAVVPITFRARMDQTPERFIRHLWLVIDQNPSPFGVKFTLTPQSGRADIETRVRLESDSPVRVVAELNDGSLWMDRKMVFGAGGCSAPTGGSASALRNLGKVRLTVEDPSPVPGDPRMAHLRIIHPQSTGMGKGNAEAPRFVRQVNVHYAGRPVLTADLDFTISENPSLRFFFASAQAGELRTEVVDSDDMVVTQSVMVDGGKLSLKPE